MSQINTNGRIIGIRHRVKKTADGEASPTQVYVLNPDNSVFSFTLDDDTSELEFVKGATPVAWRKLEDGESLSGFRDHHIKWKLIKADDLTDYPEEWVVREGKSRYVATRVPSRYEGLKLGDTVAMILGGSGDEFAYALCRRAGVLGGDTKVLRLTPFLLKDNRGQDESKDSDAKLLAELALTNPDIFYLAENRDLGLIHLRMLFRSWQDSQKARIACEQRLIQRGRAAVYLSDPDTYPEGPIEDHYDSLKANDRIYEALLGEEARRKKDLEGHIQTLPVYQQVFQPIDGCGPLIAARIMTAAVDIRRFPTKAKFRAYNGVHVRNGGKYSDVPKDKQFPRRRKGDPHPCNWQNQIRSALYLLVDQANKRENTFWGQTLRTIKRRLRGLFSLEEKSNMQVHRTGSWRTASKMSDYIFRMWWTTQHGQVPRTENQPRSPAEDSTDPGVEQTAA